MLGRNTLVESFETIHVRGKIPYGHYWQVQLAMHGFNDCNVG